MPRAIADPVHLLPPRAAYVHIPFCAHRCGYCDFTLVAGKDRLIPDYLQALERAFDAWAEPPELDTLYFGGGTPSHLPPDDLQRLFDLVLSRCRLAPGAEFTVEANPVDLDADRIACLVAAGVNRVSLGAQAFDPGILELLERDHDEAVIRCGLDRLRDQIPNVSLDLIFGVPGQSLDLWRQTLATAVSLEPAHLSTYGLTYEKGTAFWTRLQKGDLVAVPDDLEREMYSVAIDSLGDAGYEQYEISSFARPGRRSRHNHVYWSGRSYYGFGPGAARYLNGVRESEHRSVTTWLHRALAGESTVADREELSGEDRARERLVLGLRRIDGVATDAFQRETGYAPRELADSAIARFVAAGLLEETRHVLRLTRDGLFVADSVIVEML